MENLTLKERFGAAGHPPRDAAAKAATVFIVDDEPMVGEVVSVVLGMEGFNTRLFTSPTDALEAFQSAETKPDILITDFVMEPFDGLELIVRCREMHPELRTILYSGNAEADTFQNGEMKADAFLSKPFLPKELIAKVQALAAK